MTCVLGLRSTESRNVSRGTESRGTTSTSHSPLLGMGCSGTGIPSPSLGLKSQESRNDSRGTGSRGTATTPCSPMQSSGCSTTRRTSTAAQTPPHASPPSCSTSVGGRRAGTGSGQQPAVHSPLSPPSTSTTTTETPGHPLHPRVEPWSSLGQQEQGETLLVQQDPEGRKMPSGTSSPGYRGASSSTSSSSPTSGSIRNTSARKKIMMRRSSEIRNSNFSIEKSRRETGLETSLTRPALLQRSGTTSGECLQSLVIGKVPGVLFLLFQARLMAPYVLRPPLIAALRKFLLGEM